MARPSRVLVLAAILFAAGAGLEAAPVAVAVADATATGCITANDPADVGTAAQVDLLSGARVQTVPEGTGLSFEATMPVRSLPAELSAAAPAGSQAVSWTLQGTDLMQRATIDPSVSTFYLTARLVNGSSQPVFEAGYVENGVQVVTAAGTGEFHPGTPGSVTVRASMNSLSMSDTDVVTDFVTSTAVTFNSLPEPVDRAPRTGLSPSQVRVPTDSAGCLDPVQPPQPQASSADAFVDSVGVNTHLNYQPSNYRSDLVGQGLPVATNENYPHVELALSYLGVRHIRDQLPTPDQTEYIAELDKLGSLRIGSDLITPTPTTSTIDDVITALRARHHHLDLVEPANEVDNAAGESPATITARQQDLYTRVHQDPLLAGVPVLAPSLANRSNYPSFAGLSQYCDFGNLHTYAQEEPYTRTTILDSYVLLGRLVSGDRPMMMTETGYTNLSDSQGWVPEQASGSYLPKTLLTNFAAGISRTYLYELLDEDPFEPADQAHFGLFRSDYTPKPAAATIGTLLSLLSDPGPAFNPGTLAQTFSDDRVRHLLLQKRDGTFYLVLWQDARVWTGVPAGDGSVGPGPLSSPDVPVTIGLERPQSARIFRPDLSAQPQATLRKSKSLTVTIPASGVVVLELKGSNTA